MTAITFVVAAGLSLVMFVSLVNVTAMLFARGAIRAAVEEAARVGAAFRHAGNGVRSAGPSRPRGTAWARDARRRVGSMFGRR